MTTAIPDAPDGHPPASHRLPRPLLLAVLGMLGVVLGLGAWVMLDARRSAWDHAAQSGANAASLLTRELARNLEFYDLSIQAAVAGLGNPDLALAPDEVRRAALFDRAASASGFGELFVLDATGAATVRAAAGLPLPEARFDDRPYFRVHAGDPAAGLYVSAPYESRVGGDQRIALSRRVEDAEGRFAGVVVGSIRLSYLRALFEGVDLGPDGTVTLTRDDGTLILRTPFDPAQVGADVSRGAVFQRMTGEGGSFVGRAGLDGIERLFVHRPVANLPLRLNAAIATNTIDTAWRWKAFVIASVLTLFCVAAALLVGLLAAELERRAAAERSARASGDLYRLLADHSSDMIVRTGLRDGVHHYVSPAVREVLGWEPHDLEGRSWRDFAHPEDRGLTPDQQQRLMAGETVMGRLRAWHRNGGWVWIEYTSHVVERPGAAPDEVVSNVRDVTARVGAEYRLAEANAELLRLATTDGLTGLANRRSFDTAFETEWRREARSELPISLLLVDADHFKALNDLAGHQHGDACLKALAEAIGGSIRRPADLAARYGGEEFIVLLPDTEMEGALTIARKIHAAIAALNLPHPRAPGERVTVSVGVACMIPTNVHAPRVLIEQADAALYAAKRGGRNRTAVAPPAPGAALVPL